jgi:hypothetical protein
MIGMGAKSITIVRAVAADFFFDCRAAEVPSDEWLCTILPRLGRHSVRLYNEISRGDQVGNDIGEASREAWYPLYPFCYDGESDGTVRVGCPVAYPSVGAFVIGLLTSHKVKLSL